MTGINLFQILNGLTFAALLFIVASGFTLIFGLLRIVNLAHGALYLVGGLAGYSAAKASGSFVLGALAAMALVATLGAVLDRGLLSFVRGAELRQVLLTLGVAFILDDIGLVIWGGDTLSVPVPQALRGAMWIGNVMYPKYRIFVLAVGLLVFIALWLLLNKTRLGALIRAGVDDPEMVEAMGINIRRVFLGTFMLGAALAGLGAEILVFSLAVVIIGGRGSLVGAALGALLVGLLNAIGQVLFPELAYFVIFGPMALLLAFRPLGLFGRAA
jgi:branched-chain amino acid transport system permease protein